ncbi:MAG: serine hydrolase [Alphaproteobacteria bacterium]|nr:serine hydrolase [Alphaproteobacteria bacterium]MCW5739329.1 serine hydrolase [Alphaproteobacteria bacterium]
MLEARVDPSAGGSRGAFAAAVRSLLLCLSLLFIPSITRAAPDEEALGKAAGYPVGTRETWFADEKLRVGSYSHLDTILPHNRIGRADSARPLPIAAAVPGYTYRYFSEKRTIDDFLAGRRVTGLMVVKDGVVQVERYQYDRTAAHRLLSNSIAKSIAAIAVGFALAEGRIRSLDDHAAVYAPGLAGSAYGETPIRALLRMGSGVAFAERYDGKDDLTRFFKLHEAVGSVAALRTFSDRRHPPNTRFQYASTETAVLGYVLTGATGQSVSSYISDRLWRPMGAEADATWIVDSSRVEATMGYLNATLRDFGRLAMLLADDGVRDGRQIIPRDFLLEATDHRRHPPAFEPGSATPYYGYGYKFWLFPGRARRFGLFGAHGQGIFVDPGLRLALVITAVERSATSDDGFGAERDALWRGLVAHYGKW